MSLCLVLGALYLWKYETEHPRVEEPNTAKVEIFPGVTAQNTEKLMVVRAGSAFSLVKGKGPAAHWQLRRPEGARGDEKKIAAMLQTLSALKSQNVLEKSEVDDDQSIYGLQPPELVLTVEGSYGKKAASFGKKLAISGRRYLQPQNDGRIFLVDEPVFAMFNVGPSDVRDRLPIKFDQSKITELNVSRANKTDLKFSRGERGWSVQFEGGGFRVDDTVIETELNDLRKVRVKEFVDAPEGASAVYGLEKPRVVVRLRGAGAFEGPTDSMTINVGEGVSLGAVEKDGEPAIAASTGYYIQLAGQPFVYELARPFYGEFLQQPEFFRPRSPFAALKGEDILRVELEDGGKTIGSLKHAGDTWVLEQDGKETPVNAERAKEWLSDVHRLKVLSYGALKDSSSSETGLQNPAARYRIFVKDRPAPLLILLGGAVQAAESSSSGSGEQAPRWIAVSQEDGALVPAIVDHGSYAQLHRDRRFFSAVGTAK